MQDSILEDVGGVEGLLEGFREYDELMDSFEDNYSSLLEEYPDQWIVWTIDGVIAHSNDHEDMFEVVSRKGLNTRQATVEFLDTDPPVMIL